MRALLGCTVALLAGCEQPADGPEGMVWIPGGSFRMGDESPGALDDEQPVHRVEVGGFWIDRHEVTNAEFRTFVDATAYVTTAERAPDLDELMAQLPAGTAPPPAEVLVPGSLVFVHPAEGADRPVDYTTWWRWQPGADWRHPTGPESDIEGKDDHPVVQVSWDDAVAYATWAGTRLPTEAEWEYAARGGLDGRSFAWGDELHPEGCEMANVWQGTFPVQHRSTDGFLTTAPVASFPANGYGLHDMAGNVWEWCADWYRPDTYSRRTSGVAVGPRGPDDSFDPDEPTVPKRVTRGGSFLCSENYCTGYRPSARMKTSPDSGLPHTGFRCVVDPALRAAAGGK